LGLPGRPQAHGPVEPIKRKRACKFKKSEPILDSQNLKRHSKRLANDLSAILWLSPANAGLKTNRYQELMMKDNSTESELFTIRVWPEPQGDSQGQWRGKLHHVQSGEIRHFRAWPALLPLLLDILQRRARAPDTERINHHNLKINRRF
jgi:hypothetical protein